MAVPSRSETAEIVAVDVDMGLLELESRFDESMMTARSRVHMSLDKPWDSSGPHLQYLRMSTAR